jgi:crotonobetainyl-CoA:carnitine CoA-transferase CaiB-like acyl-CoA transferase
MRIRFAFVRPSVRPLWSSNYATAPARSKNRDALNAEIGAFTEKKSTDTWVRKFNAAGVPCGPIYLIDQMFEDEQVKHFGIAQDVPKARIVTSAWSLAGHTVANPEQNGGTAAGVRRTDWGSARRVRIYRGRDQSAKAGQGGV